MTLEQLRATTRVLSAGLLVAGDFIAKTAISPPQTLDAFAVGAGAALASVATSLGTGAVSDYLSARRDASLPEARALLRNHDLRTLSSLALVRTIQAAGHPDGRSRATLQVSLPAHAAMLERLAAAVPALFDELDIVQDAELAALSHDDLPIIVTGFQHRDDDPSVRGPHGGTSVARRVLSSDTWAAILGEAARRAQVVDELALCRDELVAFVAGHFPRLVVEVFAEDATGKGPSGGRGWAKLTMLFWAKLLSDVDRVSVLIGRSATNLERLVADTRAEITSKLEAAMRWSGGVDARADPALVNWVSSLHHELVQRLDTVSEMLGHGLRSPQQFSDVYWVRLRREPGMERMWSDPGRAAALTHQLIGRSTEIAEFEAFLRDPAATIQHIKGWPGTGKSRLMIEFAKCAVASGHDVFFVNSSVRDLVAALLRVSHLESLVLLWDDYRGDNPAALQTFLDAEYVVPGLADVVVKRVITTWPSHNVLGSARYAKAPQAVEKDLLWSVDAADLKAYSQCLHPSLSDADARDLVARSKAHPDITLHAIAWVLGGHSVDTLPSDILDADYDKLVRAVIGARDLRDQPLLRRTLLAMALVGEFDLGDPSHREAFAACGLREEWLGVLVDCRMVSVEQEAYALWFDGLRGHVIKRCLDRAHVDVLSGSPEEIAAFVPPLLDEWADGIWSICILATEGTRHRADLQKALLAALDARLATIGDTQALRLASRLVNATTLEPHPAMALALADRIEQILLRHPNETIALRLAQALRNITMLEHDARNREGVAARIELLLASYPVPGVALELASALLNVTQVASTRGHCEAITARLDRLRERFDTSEIALQQALAICNGVAIERNPATGDTDHFYYSQISEHAAHRIADLAVRHDTRELAVAQAQALLNATVQAESDLKCEALAEAIGGLLRRHDVAEIALAQARAYANASAKQRDGSRGAILARHIERLRARHDSELIAIEQARTLLNATRVESSPPRCLDLARSIAAILDTYPRSAELATFYAQALRNVTAHDLSAALYETIARDIERLRERHDLPEIAEQQAIALVNGIADQQDPLRRETLATQVSQLRARHDTPAIALRSAQALSWLMSGQPLSRQEDVVAQIELLLDRHRTPEIARVLALSLDGLNKRFRDSPRRLERALRLAAVQREYQL